MNRHHYGQCIVAMLVGNLIGMDCFAQRALAQEQQAVLRDYSAGSLTADDYQANVPQPLPTVGNTRVLAFTWVRIRYRYRYMYVQQGSEFTVTLAEFNAAALIDRQVSWNASPADRQLLDHEQGHFDIAHLAALRIRREIEQLRSSGTPLAVKEQSLASGVKALEAKLNAMVLRHEEASAKEHIQYDQMTAHGTIGSAQQQQRGQQRKAIEIEQKGLPVSNLNVLE